MDCGAWFPAVAPMCAMLGAFLTEAHFPIPDLLVCRVGATCDDFSAIAQRLNGMGYPVLWWEVLIGSALDDRMLSDGIHAANEACGSHRNSEGT